MTMALAAITYLDRVAIGVTRPYIARDLDLTPTQMGYVFSAFYLSYALFEIPTGWWGDKVGTRKVLTRIVCWWSAFTVLTGFAWSYSSLLLIRFLFGAGEAGAWPNVARTFSRWFPRRDRGTVQGHVFHGRASRRRPDAGARHRAARVHGLANVVHRVRIDRVHLGARVVSMVSRYAGRAPGCQRRRTHVHRRRHRQGRASPRKDAMEAAARQPHGDLPLPDVLHADLRQCVLCHVAAHVSGVDAACRSPRRPSSRDCRSR